MPHYQVVIWIARQTITVESGSGPVEALQKAIDRVGQEACVRVEEVQGITPTSNVVTPREE